ncbi:hypothetical protein [Streptomyces albus]|uniref:hypothetical protein n=1 Tax=Streptomyces albus TaxID=1888 RepID=UPI0033D9DEA9
MSPRTRTVKVPGGTVRIPRQRGHRSQPIIVVTPERPSVSRRLLGFLAVRLWEHRGALAPLVVAVAVWPLAALLHWWAWWTGLLLAPVAAVPLVWLARVQRHHPDALTAAVRWRTVLALLTAVAGAWTALAAAFGPLAGPLETCWLVIFAAVQTVWLIVRRSR